jgi:hypothetical protein
MGNIKLFKPYTWGVLKRHFHAIGEVGRYSADRNAVTLTLALAHNHPTTTIKISISPFCFLVSYSYQRQTDRPTQTSSFIIRVRQKADDVQHNMP